MKISIITVCFNSENTIANTLQSVRNQTYKNIEHIVIDGASIDNTLSIVKNEGKHVQKIISEEDSGIYDAMNKGIKLATGEVLAFLNADDIYKDCFVLEKIAQIMESENLDALYGDVEFFRSIQDDRVIRRYKSKGFSSSKLAWGWMPAHPSLFLRKKIFDRFGLFKIDYRIAGDFEFIARIFKGGNLKSRYLPESLVRMQLGGVSTSGWRSSLLLNLEIMRACKENSLRTNLLKLLLRYPYKLLEFF